VLSYIGKVGISTLPGRSARNGVAAVCKGEAVFASNCKKSQSNPFFIERPWETASIHPSILAAHQS
jgi:hypothetical protein